MDEQRDNVSWLQFHAPTPNSPFKQQGESKNPGILPEFELRKITSGFFAGLTICTLSYFVAFQILSGRVVR